MHRVSNYAGYKVDRRTGGLEMIHVIFTQLIFVDRRTGGLETRTGR